MLGPRDAMRMESTYQEVVELALDAVRLTDDLIQREAGSRQQDVVARVQEPVQRNLDRAGAPARNDDVLGWM